MINQQQWRLYGVLGKMIAQYGYVLPNGNIMVIIDDLGVNVTDGVYITMFTRNIWHNYAIYTLKGYNRLTKIG